ncbi:ubiquinone biosynthesis accessory factor UbiJ [Psychrosphaera algicola]|uniref:Ubiquinone biosynthesis accessory factor UbiJ n=2 Tax=Psychrosphaera TaxID=907197 RepID=A0ABT5FEX6_9GAMM|nr:SCP2 sterol-binding domain-containing protein [Psychrosphaera sp. G1-22]MDC2890082.1 SCP2 sterol-binding domain-containing protein [Psychrosphaera sp. G1-22]
MLLNAAFMIIEPALNEALGYDYNAKQKLAKLENKKFTVTLTDLKLSLSLLVINNQIKLMTNAEGSDCTVRTKFDKLKSLSDASVLTKLIKSDELELEGDLGIAQAYSNLLIESNIDWQEWLSTYLGDALAHRVASVIIKLNQLLARKLADIDYTVASALTDELKVTPDNIEINQFIEDVDNLHAQTERLFSMFTQFRKSV